MEIRKELLNFVSVMSNSLRAAGLILGTEGVEQQQIDPRVQGVAEERSTFMDLTQQPHLEMIYSSSSSFLAFFLAGALLAAPRLRFFPEP